MGKLRITLTRNCHHVYKFREEFVIDSLCQERTSQISIETFQVQVGTEGLHDVFCYLYEGEQIPLLIEIKVIDDDPPRVKNKVKLRSISFYRY